MTTSKDNPHKVGTAEWKDWEHQNVVGRNTIEERAKAREIADKRIKTASEQYKARHEKGVWVDKLLKEIEDLDKPEVKPMKGLTDIVRDPFNWTSSINATLAAITQDRLDKLYNSIGSNRAYQITSSPAFNYAYNKNIFPTICFPIYAPFDVNDETLLIMMDELSRTELDNLTYARGRIQMPVAIRPTVVGFNQNPTAVHYSVVEFAVRRSLEK